MAWDVTELASAARRLDGSAAFRAFVMPITLIAAVISLGMSVREAFSPNIGWAPVMVLLIAVAAMSLALSAGLTVFGDALARQPLRRISAGIALLAGIVFQAMTAAIIAAGVVLLVSFMSSAEAREEIGETLANMLDPGPYGERVPYFEIALMAAYLWLAWRTARIETVLASNVPRALLLGDIGGAGFWTRLAYLFGLPASLWTRKALTAPAFWLFILARAMTYAGALAAIGVIFLLALSEMGYPELILPGILAALVLFVGGHLVFLAAKRLAARRIWREEAEGAGPILFLRSFRDNQFRFHTAWHDLAGRWMELWTFRRNADEMLIDEFAWYAPVIALGQPGERHTPFGADRRYVDHESWQGVVADAASRAHAIIVAAGETPGLGWEYRLIAERGYTDKAVFLFPPAAAGKAEAERAVKLFNEAFPQTPVEVPQGAVLIAAVIDGGAARVVTARQPTAQAYLVALRRFLQAREGVIGRPVGDPPIALGWIALGIALPLLLLVLSGLVSG